MENGSGYAPNDKIKVGDDGEWVDLDQVGQFKNGVWRVDMRDVWAATQQDRPEGRDSRSGGASPKETSPTGEGSPLNEILKKDEVAYQGTAPLHSEKYSGSPEPRTYFRGPFPKYSLLSIVGLKMRHALPHEKAPVGTMVGSS